MVLALKKVQRYQKSTELLIRMLQLLRLVREVAQNYQSHLHFQQAMIMGLQEVSDIFSGPFQGHNFMCIYTKRVTIMPKDIYFTHCIQGERL